MTYKILPLLAFAFLTVSTSTNAVKETSENKIETVTAKPTLYASNTKTAESSFESKAESFYKDLESLNTAIPQAESFKSALKGFYLLKEKGLIKKDIITIIDFSVSSNKKRLWVIDMVTKKVLYNSLVAHGRNSGNEFATSFSNVNESFKSSLGFFATGEIYVGKHGKSLRLDGLEKNVNDNARDRAVVIHGADYVSESFIKNNHRLGRSLGCPALPQGLTNEIINLIKDKSCLYIYHPSKAKPIAALVS